MALNKSDYPISLHRPELIKTPTEKTISDINLQNVSKGLISPEDIRISKEVLQYQSDIARSCGRNQLADNLIRASELTTIPDDKILEIYNALRPHRSTKRELLAIADELESRYNAKNCARLIRNAAATYERRRVLK